MKTLPAYSVLMPVYWREKPENLQQAVTSIMEQTHKTDDFVLVCDGPLTEELDNVIESLTKKYDCMRVVRLEKNSGSGISCNEGLKHCRHDLVAKMDSDDIAKPERCEIQAGIFADNPHLDLVSATVEEFGKDTSDIKCRKELPVSNEAIREYAKRRNPINHPCVMYRKEAVNRAGGYQDFYLLEDYYLWVRMLLNGSEAYNISESLLYMRAGNGMYKRRSGLKYIQSQCRLFKWMKEKGFINNLEMTRSIAERTIASAVPNWLREKMYFVFARDAKKE